MSERHEGCSKHKRVNIACQDCWCPRGNVWSDVTIKGREIRLFHEGNVISSPIAPSPFTKEALYKLMVNASYEHGNIEAVSISDDLHKEMRASE